ncbi:Fasciclin-like arabinogalactan family protein [Euphorbia peplus]|nr:Fasciclin-like arabinogalactan family protein [Euphorbia peplus]
MVHFNLFLLHLAAVTIAAAVTTLPPPSTNTSAAASPPPHRQQINNIIDALLGAGDFNNWASLLSVADPAALPLSATLFIPSDESDSRIENTATVDPFIFPYHIVPQRLTFSDLCEFNRSSRLPTLLVSKSILITNNSVSNFTLDDSPLSHPDLFTSDSIAVHGVATLLDYSVYGEAKSKSPQADVLPRPPPGMFVPAGELISDRPQTGAAALTTEVWTFFVVFCVSLAFKIHTMSLFAH